MATKIKRIPGKSFDETLRKIRGVNLVAKVGWFESAKYEDGTPVAYVATIQEFGYPEGNIPSRSFMRSTISEKQNEWKDAMRKMARRIIHGNATAADALEVVALMAEGDIRKKITQIQDPPLKQSTLDARKRRGNSSRKPLNDTGFMLATLTSTVEKR